MFSVFKQGRKVTLDYLTFWFVFVFFLPAVIALGKDNFVKWIPFYSFLVGSLMCLVIWTDVYEFAIKEKRPIYNLSPSPYKGLLIGLLGFFPYYILSAAANIFGSMAAEKFDFTQELVYVINNMFLAPVFFVTRLLGGGAAAYVITYIFIPALCFAAYFSGNKGYTKRKIVDRIKKRFTTQ